MSRLNVPSVPRSRPSGSGYRADPGAGAGAAAAKREGTGVLVAAEGRPPAALGGVGACAIPPGTGARAVEDRAAWVRAAVREISGGRRTL